MKGGFLANINASRLDSVSEDKRIPLFLGGFRGFVNPVYLDSSPDGGDDSAHDAEGEQHYQFHAPLLFVQSGLPVLFPVLDPGPYADNEGGGGQDPEKNHVSHGFKVVKRPGGLPSCACRYRRKSARCRPSSRRGTRRG